MPPPRSIHAGELLGTFRVHAGSLSSGRTMAASARELAALGLRWFEDPGAPEGVRRYGLFFHRRYTYLSRAWEAAPLGLAARLRTAIVCLGELGRLGPGALRDMRTEP